MPKSHSQIFIPYSPKITFLGKQVCPLIYRPSGHISKLKLRITSCGGPLQAQKTPSANVHMPTPPPPRKLAKSCPQAVKNNNKNFPLFLCHIEPTSQNLITGWLVANTKEKTLKKGRINVNKKNSEKQKKIKKLFSHSPKTFFQNIRLLGQKL